MIDQEMAREEKDKLQRETLLATKLQDVLEMLREGGAKSVKLEGWMKDTTLQDVLNVYAAAKQVLHTSHPYDLGSFFSIPSEVWGELSDATYPEASRLFKKMSEEGPNYDPADLLRYCELKR